ncbi:hypothetical protein scyTo_0017553 [Scyliorhinus torazame]|uniref:Uncharacterized protein n=1 Tax=Scyliorhinus torazame TaxID=75743 RepID=A0A401PVH6_SCYTO|nr:hypothetical protein [Scyliorhinus torazame]
MYYCLNFLSRLLTLFQNLSCVLRVNETKLCRILLNSPAQIKSRRTSSEMKLQVCGISALLLTMFVIAGRNPQRYAALSRSTFISFLKMRVSVLTVAALSLFLAVLVVQVSGYHQRGNAPAEFNLDIMRGGIQDLINRIKKFISSLLSDPNFQRSLEHFYKQFTSRLRNIFQY